VITQFLINFQDQACLRVITLTLFTVNLAMHRCRADLAHHFFKSPQITCHLTSLFISECSRLV